MANVLQISFQSISKWENGIASPDIALLPAIAGYFGISIDELFDYKLGALTYKERFIKFMADNGVLRFGKFELKSGRISPYFINTGNYKTSAQLARLGEFYAECIKQNGLKADGLFGPAYKGIPLAVTTGIALFNKYGLDTNYCFDRKEVIEHGEGDRIIGHQFKDGEEFIVIGDTLTSGIAFRELKEKLSTIADVKIKHLIVSVDRMEKGLKEISAVQELQKEYGVSVYSIVTINDIITAMEDGIIAGAEHLQDLKAYREIYGVE